LLNTALCLPALEVDVLSAGFSVVAAPKRFILPGKRFALLPVQALPNALTETQIYHEDAIAKFRETAISQPDSAIQPLIPIRVLIGHLVKGKGRNSSYSTAEHSTVGEM
jgi:hypothetical protein